MEIYSQEKRAVYLPSLMPHVVHRDVQSTIVQALTERRLTLERALEQLTWQAEILTEAALLIVKTLYAGRKVLVAGNGGSAAEAQHFAAELVGRFKRERDPFAVLALTTDTAILTAVANDYGYQDVFARQVWALGQQEDLLICFSTSGESENLLCAASAGQENGMNVIAVTGQQKSSLERLADITIRAPGIDTATAQELHMVVTHILCDITESHLVSLSEDPYLRNELANFKKRVKERDA